MSFYDAWVRTTPYNWPGINSALTQSWLNSGQNLTSPSSYPSWKRVEFRSEE